MLSWLRDLETAKNVGEVLSLARACVAALPEDARSALPEACGTHEVRTVEDLQWWSERLSEEYWRRRGLGIPVDPVQDAWSFFLRAGLRTARLSIRRGVTAEG